MVGPELALGSALSGGSSDFVAGTMSRRIGTLTLIVGVQVFGILLATTWVLISGESLPGGATLAAAVGAGLGLVVNLGALFEGMVVGTISIVAPISATGVVVPIAVGISRGEHPGVLQIIGIVAAFAGIVATTRTPPGEDSPAAPRFGVDRGLGLAVIAAFGGGLFFWLMAPASRHGAAWAVLVVRVISLTAVVTVAALRRSSPRAAFTRRALGPILLCTVLGFGGITLYAFATRRGELAIVSMLASLYPAVTVVLANRLLGERLQPPQRLGVAAVLVGIVLMAGGS